MHTRVLAVDYDSTRVGDRTADDGSRGARCGVAAGAAISAVDSGSWCGKRVDGEGDDDVGDG